MPYDKPGNLKLLQSFIGLCNGYRKFVKNYAFKTVPLHDLATTHATEVKEKHKNRKVLLNWSTEAQKAFHEMRNILTTQPFLMLPKFNRPFTLETDACDYAVGAILSQTDDEECLRPVSYFSKSLKAVQRQYSTSEKELLAIVLAVENFHHYLFGHQIKIFFDYQPLIWINKTEKLSSRLNRWKIRLENHDFEVSLERKTALPIQCPIDRMKTK